MHPGTGCVVIDTEVNSCDSEPIINVVYALKQKFSEKGVGLCEEMGLQPISELF